MKESDATLALRRPTLIFIALVFSLLTPVFSQPFDAASCRSIALDDRLRWPATGAWGERGDLALYDPADRRVVSIETTGRNAGHVAVGARGTEAHAFADGGAVRMTVTGEISGRGAKGCGAIIGRPSEDGQLVVDVLWDGAAPATNGIYGLADLKTPDETHWVSAFVYIPCNANERVQIFRELDYRTLERAQYVRFDYFAAIGEFGYVLQFDRAGVSLGQMVPGGASVVDLGRLEDLGNAPYVEEAERDPVVWDGRHGAEQARMHYLSAEKTIGPAALLARGDQLWVLARAGIDDDGTHWQLVAVDHAGGGIDARHTLPTRAPNLTAIAGSPGWAFVERGPIAPSGPFGAPITDSRSLWTCSAR